MDEQLINIEEKKEDFIGWKSEDGKLEVIGIAGKDKWGAALFKVTCTECSKDKELFPDGYIVCLDKIKGIEFATRENGKVWSMDDGSEFSVAGDFKLCVLTETGYDRLVELEHQRLWIQNSEFNKFVKEI